MKELHNSIQTIKGIGPKKAALFKKLGIATIEDSLNYFPREYEYRGAIQNIASIREGMVTLCLQMRGAPKINRIRRGFNTVTWKGYDDTGEIECIWFNQPYRTKSYKSGKLYYVYGKAVKRTNGFQLQNPIVEEYDESYHNQPIYLPVYPLTNGLSQRDLRHLTIEALKILKNNFCNDEVDSYVTSRISQFKDIDKVKALQLIHYPKNQNSTMLARNRIAFEEFLNLQITVQYYKKKLHKNNKGLLIPISKGIKDSFLKSLPFELTDSQKNVLDDVLSDLSKGKIMNRLIQGDVGSGKTVIAAAALFFVAMAGYQSVMIAPTEILARQHKKSLDSLLCRLESKNNINISLLVGGMKESEKSLVKKKLQSGEIQILVGTHAVIQDDVAFYNLGLVITDEQHRFGVRQKALLKDKGKTPHMLVMSATPIPRTLAHIIHGDLDLSVIDTIPPGRVPIKTYLVNGEYRQRIYQFVKKHALEGNQTYVVCPLVEESENIDLRSAKEVYLELKEGSLKGIQIGLLHGQQGSDKKDEIMEAFSEGKIKVLITTTVIEVGVNNPNAVIMIVENAERFGLAQLHQLRGRVGRGNKPSYCILVSDIKDDLALSRLKVLVETNNGFEIAEKDLELRGPGDLYGMRQHGMPDFKVANPLTDHKLLLLARQTAKEIIKHSYQENCRKIIELVVEKQIKNFAAVN